MCIPCGPGRAFGHAYLCFAALIYPSATSILTVKDGLCPFTLSLTGKIEVAILLLELHLLNLSSYSKKKSAIFSFLLNSSHICSLFTIMHTDTIIPLVYQVHLYKFSNSNFIFHYQYFYHAIPLHKIDVSQTINFR